MFICIPSCLSSDERPWYPKDELADVQSRKGLDWNWCRIWASRWCYLAHDRLKWPRLALYRVNVRDTSDHPCLHCFSRFTVRMVIMGEECAWSQAIQTQHMTFGRLTCDADASICGCWIGKDTQDSRLIHHVQHTQLSKKKENSEKSCIHMHMSLHAM